MADERMSGGLRKPRLTKPQAGTTPNVLSVDAKPIVFAGIQIPTIRKKTALPQEKPTNKQPRPAKQPAAVSNVASGPFSMGPAAANKTGARNAFSSSLALPKDGVKTESERLGRTIMDPEYIAHEVVLETQPIPTKWTPIKLDSLNTPGPPGNILKDKLHFFQLPSTLPQTTGNNRGVLNVHKSGKITMVIDGVVFNVSPGTESGNLQSVASISSSSESVCILGEIESRFICSPSLADLLQKSGN